MADEIQPENGRLTREEIATIISLLVECEGKKSLVKSEFYRIYSRHISIDTIKDVAVKYAAKVSRLEKDLREKGETNPLARSSFRLKMLWTAFKEARIVRHRGWRKVNSEQSEKITDWDMPTQLRIIALAHQMDMDIQNLEIARLKLDMRPQSGPNLAGGTKEPEETEINADPHADDLDDGVSFG